MAKLLLLILSVVLVLPAASPPQKPNILLLCIDDLRPELACYGVNYIHSPNIDRLAAQGVLFSKHYVVAPSCGPSRFGLLTGCYGSASNKALFRRAQAIRSGKEGVVPDMPAWFRGRGYRTVSIGKVSHHPGGRGGSNWDDARQLEMPGSWDLSVMPTGVWQHPRGAMHGLARGRIRINKGDMPAIEAVDGPDSIYPDGLIADEALRQLKVLSQQQQPFFLAVGFIRPHLPFGAPKRYLDRYRALSLPPVPFSVSPLNQRQLKAGGELFSYDHQGKDPRTDRSYADLIRKHYAACVSYADAQVGKVLGQLKELELDDHTVVVLWGDHGFHLGEHGKWGKRVLTEEALHAPLIIRLPGKDHAGVTAATIVQSVDIFPTLCEIAGLQVPERVDGASLLPVFTKPGTKGRYAVSYFRGHTIRSDRYRLILRASTAELYDHSPTGKQTENLAAVHPEIVMQLQAELHRRLNVQRPSE